jgi:hypothetical protein
MSRIRVTIGKVVLRGIEAGNQDALAEGLQLELTKALANRAIKSAWTRSHRTPVMKLGAMPLQPGPSGSRNFGSGVARAIEKGLNQ